MTDGRHPTHPTDGSSGDAATPTTPPTPATQDIFRDTPVRYFGYANELGEAFKAFVSRRLYLGSYAVACAYVTADAGTRGLTDHRAGCSAVETLDTTMEALTWQGFASVAIPGLIINRVVAGATTVATRAAPHLPRLSARLPPPMQATLVGLACIPLIISPIDRGVDLAMEWAYRPVVDAALHGGRQRRGGGVQHGAGAAASVHGGDVDGAMHARGGATHGNVVIHAVYHDTATDSETLQRGV
eukprot:m.191782 g.191782  ORF g.191782 m.191782 type:complete len:243 (+) comp18455_c0_seq1:237-965(+)